MDALKAKVQTLTFAKNDTIKLTDYGVVLGVSVEIAKTSTYGGNIQYNEGANLPLEIGGPARAFGGFYGNLPVSYNGEIKVNFDTQDSNNLAIVIITILEC